MRSPTRDSWGYNIILPSAIEIAVATGVNLIKSSQAMKRVWSFNYLILIWFSYAIYLTYFISAFFFISLQLLGSVVINFKFVHLEIKLDCIIEIIVALRVTSIHVETILNTNHFITCCVHLHIDINSTWVKINQQPFITTLSLLISRDLQNKFMLFVLAERLKVSIKWHFENYRLAVWS